ncbi:MAG: alpha/beta hydrolase [Cyanobacteria bacterium P01_D01_bin.44]
MASQNRLAALLFKSGKISLLLLVGLIFGLCSLHGIGLLNLWQLPLRSVVAFWVGSGLICLLGAAVLQRPRRWLWRAVLMTMIGINGFGYLGAYVLTHAKTTGHPIGFPRPENSTTPADFGIPYENKRIALSQDEWIAAWFVDAPRSQGSVLLFPGNKAAKDRLLAPAQAFHQMGYDIGLVDFRGVGGSSGHTTTVGAREAKDVVAAVEYLRQQTDQPANAPLILYGVSMGSAAILKAVGQAQI